MNTPPKTRVTQELRCEVVEEEEEEEEMDFDLFS